MPQPAFSLFLQDLRKAIQLPSLPPYCWLRQQVTLKWIQEFVCLHSSRASQTESGRPRPPCLTCDQSLYLAVFYRCCTTSAPQQQARITTTPLPKTLVVYHHLVQCRVRRTPRWPSHLILIWHAEFAERLISCERIPQRSYFAWIIQCHSKLYLATSSLPH